MWQKQSNLASPAGNVCVSLDVEQGRGGFRMSMSSVGEVEVDARSGF